ncbi:MAG: DNA polymerase I [Proteobacteria bacterium]|nr:DNA polymerase I [Pseudomonadota bacterium]
MSDAKKIALIDGYSFVFRAYHSLPPLTRQDGTPVGAVYGFTNMLIKLLAGLNVSHVAVVFDAGSKTFRNDIFPDYKANRPPCPEDLKPQFAIVRQAAESLGLPIIEKVGFEADDVIATITKQSVEKGYEVLVVSSDKDLMQLVNPSVFMYDAMKNKFITRKEVFEKFAVEPEQVVDVLALMGDSSDNVSGVRGIGPKTAAELISEFGTLENLFANLDKIKQEKRHQLLLEGKKNAELSKRLVALCYEVELGIEIDDLRLQSVDPQRLISFLQEQGFHSLITRVKKEFLVEDDVKQAQSTKNEISFLEVKKTEITSTEMIDEIRKTALANGLLVIDCDKDFLTISTYKNNSAPKEIFYFSVKSEVVDLFGTQRNQEIVPDVLQKILQDSSIKKIFFDTKKFLRNYDLEISAFEDVSVINHLLNSSIKNDFRELVDLNLVENSEGKDFSELDSACFRNFALAQLYTILSPKISELKLNTPYTSYELPLLPVLAQIEREGIKIDTKKLHELSQEFGKKIEELTKEIHLLANCDFNVASPKQLGEILFEKLGLKSKKKSKKTGVLSTNAEVLEELEEQGFLIATKVLEFRKFSKLKNTYTDALPKEINPETNRVHTSFSSISTVTGRLNSTNPNLQNIPIRTLEGRKIREAFVAKPGHLLISADYSQIELRVIAHVAKITALIEAFKENKDIHRITAAQIFGIPESEVSNDMRSKAKAINFGIIYGISAFGLARQLDIPQSEAADYIHSYFATYPGIEEYMKNHINFAKQNGYVTTLSGRKCFVHEINNKNPMRRQESERLAINAPIQGSAADIIKKAMIQVSKALSKKHLRAKMVLQIHDELLVEVPKEEVEVVSQLLILEMENAVKLDAPLVVDLKIGERWM